MPWSAEFQPPGAEQRAGKLQEGDLLRVGKQDQPAMLEPREGLFVSSSAVQHV